jgi:hypothetical protein
MILSNGFPIEYLKFKYNEYFYQKELRINNKIIYQYNNIELLADEYFKPHPNLRIEVSNYGRIKYKDKNNNDKIKGQKVYNTGYLYVEFLFKVSTLLEETEKSNYDGYGYSEKNKYCTPIVWEQIEIGKNIDLIENEIFKCHPYLGIEVSNHGKIKNTFKEDKYIKHNGSEEFGEYVKIPIHVYRLVAETFIDNDNPKKYNTVHHVSNNGFDNTIYNLMWVTKDEHDIIEGRK